MRRDYGDSGNLTRVRLAVLALLFLIVVSIIPHSWKAWVFGVAMVGVLCGAIIAIFFARRIRPPRRRRRPKQEPMESAIEDEAMDWEHQRRF